ncbi:MAG: hypothetical protein WDO56_26455 [Gammaproteobacteria bacterium]
MKAQSFEYQLRNTAPPMADPEARLRARRAALVEFERIHDRRPAPAGRRSRSVLLGAIADACVAVIGASVVLLLPPQQREVHLPVPVANETGSASTRMPAPVPQPPADVKTDTGSKLAPLPQPEHEKVQVRIASKRQSPTPTSEPEVVVTGARRSAGRGLLSSRSSAVFAPAVATPPENRDKFEHFELNPVKRVADDLVSTFSVDVDTQGALGEDPHGYRGEFVELVRKAWNAR